MQRARGGGPVGRTSWAEPGAQLGLGDGHSLAGRRELGGPQGGSVKPPVSRFPQPVVQAGHPSVAPGAVAGLQVEATGPGEEGRPSGVVAPGEEPLGPEMVDSLQRSCLGSPRGEPPAALPASGSPARGTGPGIPMGLRRPLTSHSPPRFQPLLPLLCSPCTAPQTHACTPLLPDIQGQCSHWHIRAEGGRGRRGTTLYNKIKNRFASSPAASCRSGNCAEALKPLTVSLHPWWGEGVVPVVCPRRRTSRCRPLCVPVALLTVT